MSAAPEVKVKKIEYTLPGGITVNISGGNGLHTSVPYTGHQLRYTWSVEFGISSRLTGQVFSAEFSGGAVTYEQACTDAGLAAIKAGQVLELFPMKAVFQLVSGAELEYIQEAKSISLDVFVPDIIPLAGNDTPESSNGLNEL